MMAVERIPKEILDKLKERLDVLSMLITKEIEGVRKTIDLLTQLKPVQAGVTFAEETITSMTEFLKRQAEITRRWIE